MARGVDIALSILVVIFAVLVGDTVCDVQPGVVHTNENHDRVQDIDRYNVVDRKDVNGEASSDAESSPISTSDDSKELSKLVKILLMIAKIKGRREDGVDDDITTTNTEFCNKIVKQFELFGKHDNTLSKLIRKVLQKNLDSHRRGGNDDNDDDDDDDDDIGVFNPVQVERRDRTDRESNPGNRVRAPRREKREAKRTRNQQPHQGYDDPSSQTNEKPLVLYKPTNRYDTRTIHQNKKPLVLYKPTNRYKTPTSHQKDKQKVNTNTMDTTTPLLILLP